MQINLEIMKEREVCLGCWVVVRFPHENSSRTRDFIGQVANKINDSISVITFTKKSGNNTFIFPEKEDISHVDTKSIVGFLDEPQFNFRSQMVFPNCLKLYNL